MVSGNGSRAAGAICDKVLSCTSEVSRSECERAVNQGIATLQLVVDVDRFVQCLTSISCDRLQNDEEAIRACLDIDYDGIVCEGDLLRVCENSGRCGRLDCREVCLELASGTYDSCGPGDDGHDVCRCRR